MKITLFDSVKVKPVGTTNIYNSLEEKPGRPAHLHKSLSVSKHSEVFSTMEKSLCSLLEKYWNAFLCSPLLWEKKQSTSLSLSFCSWTSTRWECPRQTTGPALSHIVHADAVKVVHAANLRASFRPIDLQQCPLIFIHIFFFVQTQGQILLEKSMWCKTGFRLC